MSDKLISYPWGISASSVYDLVSRLMGEDDVVFVGEGGVRVSALPCLCALAVHASECGHTCLPLSQFAGMSIGEILNRLRATDDDVDEVCGDGLSSVSLPKWDAMRSLLTKHPEIVEVAGQKAGDSLSRPPFVLRDEILLLRRFYEDEYYLKSRAKELSAIAMNDGVARPDGLSANEKEMFPKKDRPGEIDEEKVEASARLLTNQFSILNGGPGTGKTFTLARVMACALTSSTKMRIRLAAPSAKAAARMKQSIMQSRGMLEGILDDETKTILFDDEKESLTVDKLLKKDRDFTNYRHNEGNPLEADWVIVDEASMLSLPMATSIFKALPRGCRLTLVGDYNQLPSVDLGHVFADLCKEIPNAVSTLKTSNRFEPGGPVDRLAKAMLGEGLKASEKPEDIFIALLGDKKVSKDVTWHRFGDGGQEDDKAWNDFDKRVVAGYKLLLDHASEPTAAVEAIGEFCVLSAMRHRKKLGCISLNRRIYDDLSQAIPQGPRRVEVPTVNLVTQNVYDQERLFNGDSFVVLPDDGQNALLAASDGQIRRVPLALIPQHELAFAETVHKVQGSEFNNVVIVLSDKDDSPLLSREMLYTALTRVKKGGHVDIWSSESALRRCVSTPTNRFTPSSCAAEVKK